MYLQDQSRLIQLGQMGAMTLVALAGIGLAITTSLSAIGVFPWLQLSASFGETQVGNAGMILQVAATVLVVLLSVFIPSNLRVLRLEASHRDFRIAMEDVLHAYEISHAEDRAGGFAMTSEFDSVRERYEYLRAHPDLEHLDGELLTVAAQMSHQSRELAAIYSDEKVARVREGLEKRRKDAERLEERIQQAYATVREIRSTLDDVEIEESSVNAQIQRLREEVSDLMLSTTRHAPRSVNSGKSPRLRSVSTGARLADNSS